MKPNPQDFLRKAKRAVQSTHVLLSDGDFEAAASRAYYAMFYCATALLVQKGFEFSTHSAVIAAYGKEYAKTAELPPEYHRWLIAAEQIRLKGDYYSSSGIERDVAEQQIRRAEDFLKASEAYLAL